MSTVGLWLHFHRFGAFATLQYVAIRMLDRLIGFSPYRCLTLAAGHVAEPPVPAGFRFREVRPSELLAFSTDPAYDLPADFLRQAEKRGDRCFGIFKGDVLANYGFVSRIPTAIDDEFLFRFPEGWLYLYKAFTHPDWRGQKLHSMARRLVISTLGNQPGVRGFVTVVSSDNHASLSSLARLGFRSARRFYLVGKGSRRRQLFADTDGPGAVAHFTLAKSAW